MSAQKLLAQRRYALTGKVTGNLAAAGVVASVAALCVVLGLAIALLPWWLVLAIGVGPVVLIGGAIWPYPILLLVLALVFQAIPGLFVPPIGSFRIHELIIIYLTVIACFRAIWRQENPLSALGPFAWPLVYLYACVLMSAIYVKFYAPNPALLSELRSYVTWLIMPLLAYFAATEKQRRTLMYFVVAIALIVAVYVLGESLLHISILANRTEILDSLNSDITRSLAGGATYLMVFALLWIVNSITAGTRWIPLLVVAALVSSAGIAMGFGRGVWIATGFGFIISTYLNRGLRGMLNAVVLASVMLALLLGGLAVVKPRVTEAMVDRALGVSAELRSGGSFRWRQLENESALDALGKSLFTGVGLGGEYKSRTSAVSSFTNETQYIHNSYIGLMVKMGIQAVVYPLWIIFAFFSCAAKMRMKLPEKYKPIFGAIVGTFCVPIVTSFTQPEWINGSGVAALCILVTSLWLLNRTIDDQVVGGLRNKAGDHEIPSRYRRQSWVT